MRKLLVLAVIATGCLFGAIPAAMAGESAPTIILMHGDSTDGRDVWEVFVRYDSVVQQTRMSAISRSYGPKVTRAKDGNHPTETYTLLSIEDASKLTQAILRAYGLPGSASGDAITPGNGPEGYEVTTLVRDERTNHYTVLASDGTVIAKNVDAPEAQIAVSGRIGQGSQSHLWARMAAIAMILLLGLTGGYFMIRSKPPTLTL